MYWGSRGDRSGGDFDDMKDPSDLNALDNVLLLSRLALSCLALQESNAQNLKWFVFAYLLVPVLIRPVGAQGGATLPHRLNF